jgi:hypothetical protein
MYSWRVALVIKASVKVYNSEDSAFYPAIKCSPIKLEVCPLTMTRGKALNVGMRELEGRFNVHYVSVRT